MFDIILYGMFFVAASLVFGYWEEWKRRQPPPPSAPNLNRLERVLHRVLNLVFRRRDIVIAGELYLRRWYLTPRRFSQRYFLHCILRPDEGTYMHDHPWPFTARILKGQYEESTPATVEGIPCVSLKVRRRGNVNTYPATHIHQVAPFLGATWTLVKAGQAEREWGFWVDGQWVFWRDHLGLTPEMQPDYPEDVVPSSSASPGLNRNAL